MRRMLVICKGSRYSRDMAEVSKVLSRPPKTWEAYQADPQKYQKVIDMELAELATAKSAGDHSAFTENLIHCAAAMLYAHHAMTCKEKD